MTWYFNFSFPYMGGITVDTEQKPVSCDLFIFNSLSLLVCKSNQAALLH